MLDNAKNFAKATVSTGYSSGAATIVLNSGQGELMPTAPFNITWWNVTDYADPSDDPNVEIDRVINVNGDTLTLANIAGNRTAQEGTVVSAKNVAGKIYKIIAGLTAKTINTDLPGMFIDSEVVSGNGTSWTLNNTPQTGSLHLFSQGTRLYPGADPNYGYTITGTAITTNASFNTGDLIADYRI